MKLIPKALSSSPEHLKIIQKTTTTLALFISLHILV